MWYERLYQYSLYTILPTGSVLLSYVSVHVVLLFKVWLMWTDKTDERQEKSIRQLAQEARQGNAHDENVLTYYRCAHTRVIHRYHMRTQQCFINGVFLLLWTSSGTS